jgi:hypothetical protein
MVLKQCSFVVCVAASICGGYLEALLSGVSLILMLLVLVFLTFFAVAL